MKNKRRGEDVEGEEEEGKSVRCSDESADERGGEREGTRE